MCRSFGISEHEGEHLEESFIRYFAGFDETGVLEDLCWESELSVKGLSTGFCGPESAFLSWREVGVEVRDFSDVSGGDIQQDDELAILGKRPCFHEITSFGSNLELQIAHPMTESVIVSGGQRVSQVDDFDQVQRAVASHFGTDFVCREAWLTEAGDEVAHGIDRSLHLGQAVSSLGEQEGVVLDVSELVDGAATFEPEAELTVVRQDQPFGSGFATATGDTDEGTTVALFVDLFGQEATEESALLEEPENFLGAPVKIFEGGLLFGRQGGDDVLVDLGIGTNDEVH